MVGVATHNQALHKHLRAHAPMAPRVALLTATALATLLLTQPVHAQATTPAKATTSEMVGNTPNDALQRQALSPYRFILSAGAAKPAAKPAVAAAPAPAPAPVPPPAPTVAAAPRPAAPSPAPVVAKAAVAPAAEPVKTNAPAVASAPAPAAPPAAAPAPPVAPVLVAAAPAAAMAKQAPAPLPPPAVVARKELVPLQQDPPVLSNTLLAEIPHGLVKLRFDVNPDGSTSGVQVASSSHRKLNSPAIAAVSKWRFQPIEATRAVEIELSFNNE